MKTRNTNSLLLLLGAATWLLSLPLAFASDGKTRDDLMKLSGLDMDVIKTPGDLSRNRFVSLGFL